MSLVVWLPLNGSLENLGASTVTPINYNAVINTAGKIGSCYHFGTANSYMILPNTVMNSFTTECSVAFWLKIKTWNTSYATYFQAGLGSTPWSHYIFSFLRNNANSNICFTISNGNTASNASYLTSNLSLDTWYHIALTYKTGKCSIYLDGSLDHEYTTSIVPAFSSISKITLGVGNATGSYQTDCDMNDFRIYNHCLSAAEVKEISQGLVLHYKLDSFYGGYGNPNLLPASDTTFFNTTRSFEFQGWVNNFYTTAWVNEHLTAGQQYTLSYTVTCISIPDTSIYSVSETRASPILVHQGSGWSQVTTTNDGIKSTNLLPGQSRTYKCTFTFATATESAGYYGFCGYTCLYRNADRTSTAYARFRIDNLKLELGSDATPWVPNINDESVDVTHIQDSSGYNHNAISNGSQPVTINSDTPKYSYSTKFISGSRIAMPIASSTCLPKNMISMNIWIKTSNAANRFISCTESGGWNLESQSGYIRFPLYISGKGYTHCVSSTATWNALSDNNWHMITITYDRIQSKIYIDGQLDTTTNSSYPNIDIGYNSNTPLTLGAEAQTITSPIAGTYVGNLSDLRIYCTALSADDIKSLYESSGNIDNKQNLNIYEVVETNSNLFAGKLLTSSYPAHVPKDAPLNNINSDGEYYFSTNGASAGSEFITINPENHTYEYDFTISVNAGNQFYIGFERYDAAKTSRSNNACIYVYATKPASDVVRQRFTGTVNLSTDGTNPCKYVTLRILNGWSGTNSGVTGTATIHSLSLREIGTKYLQKITKQGQAIEEEIMEVDNARIYKNGIIEVNNLNEF